MSDFLEPTALEDAPSLENLCISLEVQTFGKQVSCCGVSPQAALLARLAGAAAKGPVRVRRNP